MRRRMPRPRLPCSHAGESAGACFGHGCQRLARLVGTRGLRPACPQAGKTGRPVPRRRRAHRLQGPAAPAALTSELAGTALPPACVHAGPKRMPAGLAPGAAAAYVLRARLLPEAAPWRYGGNTMQDYRNMTAVEALRHAEELSGMTAAEIAAASGIGAASVTRCFRQDEDYAPGLKNIPKLCRAMGNTVLVDWLLAQTGRDVPVPPAQSRAEVLTSLAGRPQPSATPAEFLLPRRLRGRFGKNFRSAWRNSFVRKFEAPCKSRRRRRTASAARDGALKERAWHLPCPDLPAEWRGRAAVPRIGAPRHRKGP